MPLPAPQNSNREETIFHAALEVTDPTARAALLSAQCGEDLALEMRVRRLLDAHENAGGLLADAPLSPEIEAELARLKPEEGGEMIGPYKLREQIGEGGFGTVWVADQEQPVRRRVALKIIKLGMDTKEVIGRFEQERQALALMEHPNIAKVLDAGATQFGRPFFVMELVRGVKITDYCDDQQFSTAERLALFITVCHAVQHAHQKGIIHRDLKPSNILVTINDGVAVPKVIDFGVAKATQGRLTDRTVYTQFQQMIGTPLYMSPEQAEMTSLDIDTRSDIYSLGVLLYELLTGHTPIDTTTLAQAGLDEIRRIIREVDPPRPSARVKTFDGAEMTTAAKRRHMDAAKLPGALRGDLDWIVMKCLEKDRKRRYDTANGLALDLQRHLANEVVIARPPTAGYLLGRLIRRHKLAFAAGAAIAASLVIGLGASTWLFIREKAARTRAVAAEQEQSKLRDNEQQLREQAEAGEAKAKTAAAKSEQVAGFMKDMLAGVGPSVALGRDTKMLREILDKTAERLGKDLKGQPEVEAELRSTLGGVYLELGDYPKGQALLKEALDLRRKLHGSEHRSVAESLRGVAFALLAQGKVSEAETLARESLAICRKLPGDDDEATAETLHILATIVTRQMKLTEAEALHREAVALFRKLHGAEHGKVASALTELAFNQHMEGKLAESESLYREALAMQRKLVGNDHPDLVISVMALAFLVEQQGRMAEAEAMYRECLAMQRKFFGNEHPNLAATLSLLAGLVEKQGRQEEAETLREEAAAIWKKAPGSAETSEAQAQAEKGVALLQQGKWAEAETQMRAALTAFRKLRGNDDPATQSIIAPLAMTLERQERWAEAEALNREALIVQQKLGNGEQPAGAQARFNLARTLHQNGNFAEAKTHLREAATLFKKLVGAEHSAVADTLGELADVLDKEGTPAEREAVLRELLPLREKAKADHWRTFEMKSRLGVSLIAQKKYAEAGPWLLSGYEGMKARETAESAKFKIRIREVMESLVQLFEATGDAVQAAEWKLKLAEFGRGLDRSLLVSWLSTNQTGLVGFANLDFETGKPGEVPEGWFVPPTLAKEGFQAALTTEQPRAGKMCAEIRWPANQVPLAGFANLMQFIDATPYRNKRIVIRAAVRVSAEPAGGRAQMWFRVDRKGNRMGAFDNMDDRPVLDPAWQNYTITADVDDDAQGLNLGLMTMSGTTAWWDDIRVEVIGDLTALKETARPAGPLAAIEETLKATKAKLGPDHLDTLASMNAVALAYERGGRLADAEPIEREILAKVSQRPDRESTAVANFLAQCAFVRLLEFRHASAEPFARECLAIREKLAPNLGSTSYARSMLGSALLGQRKLAEAEPLLRSSYEGLTAHDEKIPLVGRILIREFLERVVQLHETAALPEPAAEWKQKLAAFPR